MALKEFAFFNSISDFLFSGATTAPEMEAQNLLKIIENNKRSLRIPQTLIIEGETYYLGGTFRTEDRTPPVSPRAIGAVIYANYYSLKCISGGAEDGYRPYETTSSCFTKDSIEVTYERPEWRKWVKRFVRSQVKTMYKRSIQQIERNVKEKLDRFDDEVQALVKRGAEAFTSRPRLSALDSAIFHSDLFLKKAGVSAGIRARKLQPLKDLLDDATHRREAWEAKQAKEEDAKEEDSKAYEDSNTIKNNPFAALLG